MKVTQVLAVAALTAVLALAANDVSAQGQGGNGGGRRGQGGPGGGNFDPAQMQQRMMERTKENLEITDETEWKAIEPLVQKVMDARMSQMGGMGRGMMGGRRGGPGGTTDTAAAAPATRRPGMFGQPSPEAEALQRAIDSKASNSELKTAVAKYNDARKAKQAELEKAQSELRKVLSVRQEALAALNGLL